MSRGVRRVDYRLDPRGIKSLPREEVAAILRGADDLIMQGGRTLLVKVLRGSRDRKVLELGLERSPVYGYYAHLPAEDVLGRVDWVILRGYLRIAYDYRLPLLVYSEEGWEIERETYAEELLRGFDARLAGPRPYDMSDLKDRNRGLILLLLDKVEATHDTRYIPLLEAWAQVDYKKVCARIRHVIGCLSRQSGGPRPAAAPPPP